MPDACCSAVHPLRVTLERRRSDFERDARVTPFTGSCCCCCCCLHWIAAGVGGIAGMRTGWITAEAQSGAPVEPETRSALVKGILAGIFVPVTAGVVAGVVGARSVTEAFAMLGMGILVVPSVVFLPIGCSMMLAAFFLRRKKLAAFRRDARKLPQKDGTNAHGSLYRMKIQTPPKTKDPLVSFSVFCRHCWGDLGESLHLTTCPECGVAIDRPVISGPDYGMSIARSATARGFGMATAATLAAYVLMWLLLVMLK